MIRTVTIRKLFHDTNQLIGKPSRDLALQLCYKIPQKIQQESPAVIVMTFVFC